MQTKKRAIRVIIYFVNFAICSACIQYRNNQTVQQTERAVIWDRFEFRSSITENLIYSKKKCFCNLTI